MRVLIDGLESVIEGEVIGGELLDGLRTIRPGR